MNFFASFFFDVANRDVEEIAALSKHAWETFEDSGDYSAEPQGLFRQAAELGIDTGPAGPRVLATAVEGRIADPRGYL